MQELPPPYMRPADGKEAAYPPAQSHGYPQQGYPQTAGFYPPNPVLAQQTSTPVRLNMIMRIQLAL